ncbi:hypothetical protein F4815DRAFT_489451, partial [Daldinia loculata]
MILPCLFIQLLLLNPWDSLGIENATHASSLARSTPDIHYFLLGIGSTIDSSGCKIPETGLWYPTALTSYGSSEAL